MELKIVINTEDATIADKLIKKMLGALSVPELKMIQESTATQVVLSMKAT